MSGYRYMLQGIPKVQFFVKVLFLRALLLFENLLINTAGVNGVVKLIHFILHESEMTADLPFRGVY